jgi:hypothetical protein
VPAHGDPERPLQFDRFGGKREDADLDKGIEKNFDAVLVRNKADNNVNTM